METSHCCHAPMIGGVQCETCGADGRAITNDWAKCPICSIHHDDPLQRDCIKMRGKCLGCDHLEVERREADKN